MFTVMVQAHQHGVVHAIACDGCHKASNILQGKHGTHYGTATVATNRTAANNSSGTTYIFNCGVCHDPGATTHGGGAVSGIQAAQVAFDATYAGGGTYTAGGTLAGTDNGFNWTAGATNNACSNTYCHSQGTSLTTPYAAPNITSFQWTSSTLTCSGCHGNPPAYANGSPKANSHSAHSAYTCNTCHVNTTSGGTTITNKANHVNKAYNVDAGAGASFTYTYNVAGGTCSNISCHCNASIPAQWGATSACLDCHSGSCGNRAAITPQFSANSHHIQGVSLTSAHCYQCHWEANSDGTINHTYHGGSAAPGSVVDLVIYGIGTRPTTYTVRHNSHSVYSQWYKDSEIREVKHSLPRLPRCRSKFNYTDNRHGFQGREFFTSYAKRNNGTRSECTVSNSNFRRNRGRGSL